MTTVYFYEFPTPDDLNDTDAINMEPDPASPRRRTIWNHRARLAALAIILAIFALIAFTMAAATMRRAWPIPRCKTTVNENGEPEDVTWNGGFIW